VTGDRTQLRALPCFSAAEIEGLNEEQFDVKRAANASAPPPRVDTDLIIIDDILPTTFSPFRTLEYRHYLQNFDAIVLSSERWMPWVPHGSFEDHAASFPIEDRLRHRPQRFANGEGIAAAERSAFGALPKSDHHADTDP
jgi:hypothetical protein